MRQHRIMWWIRQNCLNLRHLLIFDMLLFLFKLGSHQMQSTFFAFCYLCKFGHWIVFTVRVGGSYIATYAWLCVWSVAVCVDSSASDPKRNLTETPVFLQSSLLLFLSLCALSGNMHDTTNGNSFCSNLSFFHLASICVQFAGLLYYSAFILARCM